jgi:2'-hydroxyisoflavone reductase
MTMTDRRDFIRIAAGTAGALGLYASGLGAATPRPASKPLNILILGGTGFIGPHQVNGALERGHTVTTFNRGRRAGMYGGRVEELIGNRDPNVDDGLSTLEGDREWDVVIDNSGYVPRHVRASAELLKGRCGRYLYISTVAVYDFESSTMEFPEAGPLAPLADKSVEEVTGETYGPLKAECDRIVRDVLGDTVTVVRPAYILGPGDTTDRFTYWVERINKGGDVVGPSQRERPVQGVDVRDLTGFVLHLVENDIAGSFNAAGPAYPREGLLWAIRGTTSEPVRFHWATPELIEELGLSMPMMDWGGRGPVRFRNEASIAAGMSYRAIAETVVDTHAWWTAQPAERRDNPRRWMSPEQEKEALARLG